MGGDNDGDERTPPSPLSSPSSPPSSSSSSSSSSRRTYCALKVLNKSDLIRLGQVDHVRGEVDVLRMVRGHPLMVGMLEGSPFQDGTHLFLALEYVQGGELYTRMRREGR